jgi:hypothetical protein
VGDMEQSKYCIYSCSSINRGVLPPFVHTYTPLKENIQKLLPFLSNSVCLCSLRSCVLSAPKKTDS